MNEHVRRSGRQTVATKLFDPSNDSPMPQKQPQSKKTGSTSDKSKELFKSDVEEEKRGVNAEIPTDSANKNQKIDVFELTSDEEIEGRENSKSLANKKGAGRVLRIINQNLRRLALVQRGSLPLRHQKKNQQRPKRERLN